ncbi:hypothetical protein WK17_17185 [Burkholderia multivorans]|nr:hypothetical protein WK17_17185 [Burkholderia multivorans]
MCAACVSGIAQRRVAAHVQRTITGRCTVAVRGHARTGHCARPVESLRAQTVQTVGDGYRRSIRAGRARHIVRGRARACLK